MQYRSSTKPHGLTAINYNNNALVVAFYNWNTNTEVDFSLSLFNKFNFILDIRKMT